MKFFRSSPLFRALAGLLALVFVSAAAFLFGCAVLAYQADCTQTTFPLSTACGDLMSDYQRYAWAELYNKSDDREDLPWLDKLYQDDAQADLSALLDPAATRFRYRVLQADGTPVSPAKGSYDAKEAVTPGITWYASMNRDRILSHYTSAPRSGSTASYYPAASYVVTDYVVTEWGSYSYSYSRTPDSGISAADDQPEYILECTLAAAPIDGDPFTATEHYFSLGKTYFVPMVVGTVVLAVLAAALVILLSVTAGRRKGADGVSLTWFDRVWFEVILLADLGLCALALFLVDQFIYALYDGTLSSLLPISVSMAAMVFVGCLAGLATLLTFVVRCKARSFWSTTLLGWLWRLVCRVVRAVSGALRPLPMTGRAILAFLAYLAGTVLTALTVVLAPFYQLAVLVLICRWVRQWKALQAGTDAILAGNTQTQVDTKRFYPDLAHHGEQLNHLSQAVSAAAEKQLKSERFRSELITNVSHDLKTPLTSIINYVDLLKKEDIQDPKAQEYIQVLDRKAQRLNTLTQDLIEASKASTGALSVTKERLGLAQLASQALGEYEEKFAAAELIPCPHLPEDEVYVNADGRHLWRVLDNLFSNCTKYALPGTRVYVDLVQTDGKAVLSVKNISRDPLNIPADELMERFVRGDDARSGEGSGLGLSIARSLTVLQGGEFSLEVDGDLFKATITLPAAPADPAA